MVEIKIEQPKNHVYFHVEYDQNVCAFCLGCGVSVAKQQGAQRRIVGGDEAGFGSFPWQVII